MRRDQKTKRVTNVAITAIVFGIVITLGCQKITPSTPDADALNQQEQALLSPEPVIRLQYRDSLLFYKTTPRNYTVRPIKTPNVPGYFTADAEGLKINATNGAIEVNESEGGLRYKIYYMSLDNQPIDSANITIAGIDYQDGIFEINASPDHETAVPVYKGSSTGIPCVGSGGVDSNASIECVFDETDLDGNGTNDIPGANESKLRVNKKTGYIDLEQSLTDGLFGTPTPANGRQKDVTIYYRVNDASQRAVNRITVRLYHFTSMDKIPAWLLDELKSRKEATAAATVAESGGTIIQSNVLSLLKPKRPPLIIIVSGYTTL